MVDFRKLLSPETVARLDAKRHEIERLYNLSDRWLAEEILKLARSARDIYPERLGWKTNDGSCYETNFVWDLVPEIAARLGASRFTPGERSDRVRGIKPENLRDWVGSAMPWIGDMVSMEERDFVRGFHPWEMLSTEFVNGNPIVFALDRVAPPSPDSTDWCARHMREISSLRGFGEVSAWHPRLSEPRHSRKAGEDLVGEVLSFPSP